MFTLNKIDDLVLQHLHDTTIKNIILIALAFYCVVFVKQVPDNILVLVNNLVVRVAVIVTIIYIGRKHIDLGIMMGLAFYFTVRQANKIDIVNTVSNKTTTKKYKTKEKPRTETKPSQEPVEDDENCVDNGMRVPFHQSKYVEDLTQPAHQLQQFEQFTDAQSYNQPRLNPETCPMMRDRDESCIQGLTKVQGNIPSGYTDLNNLSNF